MDTLLDTDNLDAADTLPPSVRQSFDGPAAGQPKAEWVRGTCPVCFSPVVSNCYYVGGRGYLVVWECWNALGEYAKDVPDELRTCRYRRVL